MKLYEETEVDPIPVLSGVIEPEYIIYEMVRVDAKKNKTEKKPYLDESYLKKYCGDEYYRV
jgi:hypothetical protein